MTKRHKHDFRPWRGEGCFAKDCPAYATEASRESEAEDAEGRAEGEQTKDLRDAVRLAVGDSKPTQDHDEEN